MSDKLVLIDTSIWIEYFRGKNSQAIQSLDLLLDSDRVVSLDVIEAELYRGSRSQKEIDFLEEYFGNLPHLSVPDGGWLHVGRFAYQLSRKGYRPHLIDSFIAITAIHNEIPLWSADKDFTQIAALTELKLFEPSA